MAREARRKFLGCIQGGKAPQAKKCDFKAIFRGEWSKKGTLKGLKILKSNKNPLKFSDNFWKAIKAPLKFGEIWPISDLKGGGFISNTPVLEKVWAWEVEETLSYASEIQVRDVI